MPLDPVKSKQQIAITVPKSCSVRNFLEKLGEVVGVAPENLMAVDIFKNDVYELFHLTDPITKLTGNSGVDVYIYQLDSVASVQQTRNEAALKSDPLFSFVSRSSSRDEDLQSGMESSSEDLTLPLTTAQYYDDEFQWTNVICSHTSEVIFNRLQNIKRSNHQERE